MKRLSADTLRVLPVMALAWAVAARAGAEETPDAVADLRAALRTTAPLEERVAALERAAKAPRIGDTDTAVRAAVGLIDGAPAAAATLMRRALEEAPPSDDVLREVREAAANLGPTSPPGRQAVLIPLGMRDVAAFRPATPELVAALRFDAPELETFAKDPAQWPADDELLRDWGDHARAAGLLDRALADDAGVAGEGPTPMQVLVKDALGAATRRYLLAVASPREGGTPAGLVPRRVRAIVALGLAGPLAPPSATPVVLKGLDDANGWIRVAAANALGDLGDPAAVAPLCRVLFYLGDRHRLLDSWDYPGASNVGLTEEQWQSVEYHSIDQAAADALLELGVRNAGGWLIDERLDPRRGNWRIRVPQDAADALRRAFEKVPVSYPTDGSIPDRLAAWRALRAWWKTRPPFAGVGAAPRIGPIGPDGYVTFSRLLDENDAGYRAGLAPVVAAITGSSVMEQQIAGSCVELLGSAATPMLLEALPKATKRIHRAQLAVALGRTHDPRAVPALVSLSTEDAGNVRAAAVVSLGPFVREGPATKEALDAALERTADVEENPRAAAFEALVNAPLDPRVREAARKARGDGPPGPDDAASVRVVLLVQTGEGLDDILGLLRSPELWRRRQAWELLRRALDLEPDLFDPVPDPPKAKPIDAAAVAEALKRRRTPE